MIEGNWPVCLTKDLRYHLEDEYKKVSIKVRLELKENSAGAECGVTEC